MEKWRNKEDKTSIYADVSDNLELGTLNLELFKGYGKQQNIRFGTQKAGTKDGANVFTGE